MSAKDGKLVSKKRLDELIQYSNNSIEFMSSCGENFGIQLTREWEYLNIFEHYRQIRFRSKLNNPQRKERL